MAKGNKTQPAVTLAGNTVTTSTVPAVVLAVKQGANFRGARAAWYAVLTQYNGQPAAAYLAHCAANPPSLPTKGKHAGTAEKPTGWLAWFVRNGYATLS